MTDSKATATHKEPQTPTGKLAQEQHKAGADWDAIAAAVISAAPIDQTLEHDLQALKIRHQRLVDAANRVCDTMSELFAVLAQETHRKSGR